MNIGSIKGNDGSRTLREEKTRISNRSGYLKVILGCMFSGKTSEIIKEYNKLKSINIKVLCINYILDDRYSNESLLHSHDQHCVDCVKVKNLSDVKNIEEYDEILINEGQFFSDLFKMVQIWVDNFKKNVFVAGLDGDFKRGKFGQMLDLIPICDDVVKTHSYCTFCKDRTRAIFTWKLINKSQNGDNQVEIGSDQYIPLCRYHYLDEVSKDKSDSDENELNDLSDIPVDQIRIKRNTNEAISISL